MRQFIKEFLEEYTDGDNLGAHAIIVVDCLAVSTVLGIIHHLFVV